MAARPDPVPPIVVASDTIADRYDADVLFYSGQIHFSVARKFSSLIQARSRRPNVVLILVTYGGDPDAAYRMSRCLQDHYTKVLFYASGFCKSAGTLLALGAQELILSDDGELGPIDVQMSKRDELFESQSGLVVGGALQALHERAYNAFQHFFYEFKAGVGRNATLRTASDIAVNLTTGLFGPIYQQIDPMHVGESGRSITIAKQYGQRLQVKSQNYTTDALDFLISEYPSHSFVIDREEAKKLFKNVTAADPSETNLATLLGEKSYYPQPYREAIENVPEFLSTERAAVTGGENGNGDAIQLGARPTEVTAGAGTDVQNDGLGLNRTATRRN